MISNALAVKAYKLRLVEKGLCTQCRKPVEDSKKMCRSCLDKSLKRRKECHDKYRVRESVYQKQYYRDHPKKKINSEIYRMRRFSEWRKYFESIGMDKCVVCGYSRCSTALEFHHLNPNGKEINISALTYYKISEERKAEISKCIMLCANCHREHHANERITGL